MKQKLQALQNVSDRVLSKGTALVAAGTAAVLASPLAQAAIDVTPVVTEIGDTKEPIGLVGVAVLGVLVALLAFSMVRRSLRG